MGEEMSHGKAQEDLWGDSAVLKNVLGTISGESKHFCYLPLPQGEKVTRLIRLLPNEDRDSAIHCELFDYALEPHKGGDLYEALSYVWGTQGDSRHIYINNTPFTVTKSLYKALLHLRNESFPRIIWVDAICIDQCNEEEKERQIQFMGTIYGYANRVVIWLGEEEDNGGQALQDIRAACTPTYTPKYMKSSQVSRTHIFKLLERPWFRRIWVLQEVALARRILIMCGYSTINGYAFCHGLSKLGLSYEEHLGLQALIGSVTFLISGAIFRPEYKGNLVGDTSLPELIDMYHTREATYLHDKLYALLGMSSIDPAKPVFRPNYQLLWSDLLHQIVQMALGNSVSVKTWHDEQMALIQGRGIVVGKVVSVEPNGDRYDSQEVEISFSNTSAALQSRARWGSRWTLRSPAKPIYREDIVCILEGASKPVLIRAEKDYFVVIMIAITPLQDAQKEHPRINSKALKFPGTDGFDNELLLIWDWTGSAVHSPNSREQTLNRSGIVQLLPHFSSASLDNAKRLHATAIILNDAGVYSEARSRLRTARDFSGTLGDDHPILLSCLDLYALTYKREKNWKKAIAAFSTAIEARKGFQGSEHPDTLETMAYLASVYLDQSNLKGWDYKMMSMLVNGIKQRVKLTEKNMIRVLQSRNKEFLTFLLEFANGEVPLTSKMVYEASYNRANGKQLIMLLLNRRSTDNLLDMAVVKEAVASLDLDAMAFLLDKYGNGLQLMEAILNQGYWNRNTEEPVVRTLLSRRNSHVKKMAMVSDSRSTEITALGLRQEKKDMLMQQSTAIQMAKYYSEDVVASVLDEWGIEIKISEEIMLAAMTNEKYGKEVLQMLLSRKFSALRITEDVMECVLGNKQYGTAILELLLDNAESGVPITAPVMELVAGNGTAILKLLFDRRPNDIELTEDVVNEVSRNESDGYEMMEIILERLGVGLPITVDVVETAARNRQSGLKIMKLLFDRLGKDTPFTTGIVVVAMGNDENGSALLKLLLDQQGDNFQITTDIMKAAALNNGEGYEIIRLLLDWMGNKIPITSDIVEAAASNRQNGLKIIRLLLERFGNGIPFTEEAMVQCAKSLDEKAMDFLLNWLGDRFMVMDDVVNAVMENENDSGAIMELLLDREKDQVQITEQSLLRATQFFAFGPGIMESMLNHLGNNVQITWWMIETARQGEDSRKKFRPLLDQLQDGAVITNQAIIWLLQWSNKKDIQPLLDQLGDSIPITDGMIEAITKNFGDGDRIMKFLLDKVGSHIHISATAAINVAKRINADMLTLLLDKVGKEFPVTEEVLKVAVGASYNSMGNEMLSLIFEHCGRDIPMTQDVVRVAAKEGTGETFAFLLDQWGESIEITDKVMKAAMRHMVGEKQLGLIYAHKGKNVTITENVVLGVRRDQEDNGSLLFHLFDLWGDKIQMTKGLIQAMARSTQTLDRDPDARRRNIMVKKILGFFDSDTPIADGGINEMARSFDEESFKYFLDRFDRKCRMTSELVGALRENEDRNAIVWFIVDRLGNDTMIGEEVLADIATSFDEELMGLLLDRCDDGFQVTERIMKAVARNSYHARSLIELFLERFGYTIPITEEIMVTAMQNSHDGDLLSLVLNRKGKDIRLTEEILELIACAYDEELMRLALEVAGNGVDVTAEVIEAAARNEKHGDSIIKLLLGRIGDDIKITDDALLQMIRSFDREVIRIVLDRPNCYIRFTGKLIEAAAENDKNGKRILRLLLLRLGGSVQATAKIEILVQVARLFDKTTMRVFLDQLHIGTNVSDDVLEAAAGNIENGVSMMRFLLHRLGDEAIITEKVMRAAAENEDGEGILALIYGRWGKDITITENILETAVRNKDGKKVISFIMSMWCKDAAITERVFKAAAVAQGWNAGQTLSFVLARWGKDALIPHGILEAAMRNGNNLGDDVVAELLQRQGDDVPITEALVMAAVATTGGETRLRLIIDRWGNKTPITEAIIVTALENWGGVGILKVIFDSWRTNMPIRTEGLLKAAAQASEAKDAFELVLYELGRSIQISEEVVVAAAGNSRGKAALEFIHENWGQDIKITAQVLLAAAANLGGERVFKFILDTWGAEIPITTEVIKAAVDNPEGLSVLELIVEKWGSAIPITEDIVKGAAANPEGREMLFLIVETWGKDIPMTEEVIKEAVGNLRGKEVLLLIFWRWGREVPITEAVVEAAIGNPKGKEILTFITEQWGNEILNSRRVKSAADETGHAGIFREFES